jgi:3-oxoacyl-[acyl-carrier protein] reductase
MPPIRQLRKKRWLEFEGFRRQGELLQFDVQVKQEVDDALNNWKQKNEDKTISVLVNNAGVTRDGLFMWMPEKDWDEVLGTSAKGLFQCYPKRHSANAAEATGRIVNIASVSGMKGVAGQPIIQLRKER